MFYYFGRKGRLASRYPSPEHDLVIEPFAGSMAYTLHHRPIEAIGVEADPRVVETWHRVVDLSPMELLAYPAPEVGDRTDDRWHMLAAGSHGTARADSYLWTDRMARDFAKQRRLAVRHQHYASRHVTYIGGDYRDAPDVEATWFIDPPYQHVRRGYERDAIDYHELAEWVRSRRGLVIVCEQAGADWLDFTPLADIRGTTNKRTTEMIHVQRRSSEVAA